MIDRLKYRLLCSDNDYMPASDDEEILDEIDSRQFMQGAAMLVVREDLTHEELVELVEGLLVLDEMIDTTPKGG